MSSQSSIPPDRLVVALDHPTASSVLRTVEGLDGICTWYKVGLELYLAEGKPILKALIDRNLSVFLDLKLHDIPNTVAGAIRSISDTGASLLTVHAAGGPAMLEAAANQAAKIAGAPRLLAVTVLTSMDSAQLGATGVTHSPHDQALILGRMAIQCGMDGLICSGHEIAPLRSALGEAPLLIVPGIRPASSAIGDQKRIVTPSDAIRSGATKLVVGRPITSSPQPRHAAQAILDEIAQAQAVVQI